MEDGEGSVSLEDEALGDAAKTLLTRSKNVISAMPEFNAALAQNKESFWDGEVRFDKADHRYTVWITEPDVDQSGFPRSLWLKRYNSGIDDGLAADDDSYELVKLDWWGQGGKPQVAYQAGPEMNPRIKESGNQTAIQKVHEFLNHLAPITPGPSSGI